MSARMLISACLFLMLLPALPRAQGYAGLGTAVEGYAEVTRPAALAFPRDHGPHPEYRIEWWYLTAALEGSDGRDYGIQWTLFRVATRPDDSGTGWNSGQVWIGHAGLTTPERHFHAERFARGGIGQAGAEAEPFRAWIDSWSLVGTAPDGDAFDALAVTARGEDFAYALQAEAKGPLVLNGDAGFSLKAAEGQASYYYSQPFLDMQGTLTVEGQDIAVRGTGWIDREWSSQHMSPEQVGWDWFSLHLADGHRLMAYRLRDADGEGLTFGTWARPDGSSQALPAGAITMTPRVQADVAGRRIPVGWTLDVPSLALTVDTEAVNPQSWMGGAFPYWEGPIRVSGSHEGRGYLEMVGY